MHDAGWADESGDVELDSNGAGWSGTLTDGMVEGRCGWGWAKEELSNNQGHWFVMWMTGHRQVLMQSDYADTGSTLGYWICMDW